MWGKNSREGKRLTLQLSTHSFSNEIMGDISISLSATVRVFMRMCVSQVFCAQECNILLQLDPLVSLSLCWIGSARVINKPDWRSTPEPRHTDAEHRASGLQARRPSLVQTEPNSQTHIELFLLPLSAVIGHRLASYEVVHFHIFSKEDWCSAPQGHFLSYVILPYIRLILLHT